MKSIKTPQLLNKLKGIHTIESIARLLKVKKQKAVYYIYRLRKKGYVKTKRTSEGERVYEVSFENKLKGVNPIEIINRYSPIKVFPTEDYQIYGKSPTPEETLSYAINSKDFRIILASLILFRKIKNWTHLYKLAKQSNIKRKICALYELTRRITRTRKMPRKFRKNCLPKKNEKYEFIIQNLKSENFKEIEKLWRVHIPFNIKDLEIYKK